MGDAPSSFYAYYFCMKELMIDLLVVVAVAVAVAVAVVTVTVTVTVTVADVVDMI
jgi:hypothetical protein